MTAADRLSNKIDVMNSSRKIPLSDWIPAEDVAKLFKIEKKQLMENIREGTKYSFNYSTVSGNETLIYKKDVERYIVEQSTIIQ